MFTVKYHPEAEKKLKAMPTVIRAKLARLITYILRILIKKTQKIPAGEISLAVRRLEEVKRGQI